VSIKAFSRAVLRATVQPRIDQEEVGPPIVFFVAHLKSKRPMWLDQQDKDRPGLTAPDRSALGAALSTIRRTAEAAALRMVVNSAMASTAVPVVVLGDINDGQQSNTVNILSTQPRYRLIEASGVGRSSSKGLYLTQTLQQLRSLRDVYYTHIYDGFRESLDHVLVSQHFYDESAKRVWAFNHMTVHNDHLEEEEESPEVTDHGVVKVVFDFLPEE